MAHLSLKDKLNQAIWLTGAPGCGFNTVGSLLGGFMTDKIGYRDSHLNHREWKVSIPCLRYRITDPELRNPYFYGFGQNFDEMVLEPWSRILVFNVSYPNLLERVTKYRMNNKINDGSTHSEVAKSLFKIQTDVIKSIGSLPRSYILDANPSPNLLVSAIRLWNNDKAVAAGQTSPLITRI